MCIRVLYESMLFHFADCYMLLEENSLVFSLSANSFLRAFSFLVLNLVPVLLNYCHNMLDFN